MGNIDIHVWCICCRAPNDDYTPGNLQTVTDNIYLNLFDQVLIDIQEVRITSDLAIQLKSIWLGNSCQNHAYIHYNCLSLITINISNIQHTCKYMYYMLYDYYSVSYIEYTKCFLYSVGCHYKLLNTNVHYTL